MALKDKLQVLIKAGREKEASDLLPHVDDAPPATPGRWTARDSLAHMTAWRRFAAAELEAVRTGGEGPDTSEEINEFNARVYEATRDQPAATVLAEARRSWDALLESLVRCSDEDLLKPRLRSPEQPLWSVIPGNTYFHVSEHLGYFHTERGEDSAAEAAAKWAYDIANQAFTEDRHRANADYNLGCFYSVRGRAEEAMPYLRRAIELNPKLREWARQDTDLDPIRSAPELAGLLADT
jgi:tetratricopeptide (TPR) repeat protein